MSEKEKRLLFAGTAKIPLTPSDDEISEYRKLGREQFLGVSRDIYARALILRQGDRKVLILGAEIIKIPDYDVLCEALAGRCGFRREDIFMGGTQNHQCIVPDPVGTVPESRPGVLKDVQNRIHRNILEGVASALDNLQPAKLGWGTGVSLVNTNPELNSAQLQKAEREGRIDRELFVLRVDTPEGQPLACLTVYDMNGTLMGAEKDNMICGDIHGAISEEIEKCLGNSAVAINLIGASADAVPLLKSTFEIGYADGPRRFELPREAREGIRDYLAARFVRDAMDIYNSISCTEQAVYFRSGELRTEADGRKMPDYSKGSSYTLREKEGKLTHRLHLLSISDRLVFVGGNSITGMKLGKLVKEALPVKTVYVSVEGGSIGYVMDAEESPDSAGSKRSPLFSHEESQRIYLESVEKLWNTAE